MTRRGGGGIENATVTYPFLGENWRYRVGFSCKMFNFYHVVLV